MHPVVESRRDEVAEICRRLGVQRLEVFGSAARDDFDEARSDIDFLVEFGRQVQGSPLATWFALKEQLEALFARRVDLVFSDAIENPFVRASVDRNRQVVYEP